jgi:very-short-patch-repair endonuclease
MRSFDALGALLRRQHGVVTRAQALEAGLSSRGLERMVRAGELVPLARGLYCSAAVPVGLEQLAMGACLLTGGVASHLTAAVLHGLEGIRPGRLVEVTVPHGRRLWLPFGCVHQARHLDAVDVVRVQGIPCTGPARTLVDSADQLTIAQLTEAVDGAVVAGLTTPGGLRAARERAGLPRVGGAALEIVLATWTPGPDPGSVAEMRLLREMRKRGFPEPERQVVVRDERGRFVARVDFAYRLWRILIEYDGRRRHLNPHRPRENRLAALGYTVLVATAEDLRPGPSPFWEALAAAIAAATRAGRVS